MKRLIRHSALVVIWCFVIASLLMPDIAAADEQEVVAVCHFETGDFSFANSQTATSLAEVVQIELQSVDDVAWVERKQVDQMIAELGLGFSPTGNALQLGSLLKADILIKGVFTPVPKRKFWKFELEFIDLDRADVLLRRSFSFGKSAAEKMPVSEKVISDIVKVTKEEFPGVAKRRNQLKDKILIATLHFQNVHQNDRLDFLEQDLKREFAKRNNDASARRYLQFPRSRDAQQESELIASGIVRADLDAWQRIGDHYFWGEYQEVDSSGVDFDDVEIEFTIWHWDGAKTKGEATVGGKVGDKKDLIDRVIDKVESIATKKQAEVIHDQTRETIAEQIYSHYESQALLTLQSEYRNSSEISTRWLRLWARAKRRLYLASFFDPNNEKISRELLVEITRDDVPHHQFPGAHRFWQRLENDRAWDSFCKKFGFDFKVERVRRFKSRPGALSDNRVGTTYFATRYLETLKEVIQIVHGELNPRERHPKKTDVPDEVLEKWLGEFGQNYLARLKTVVAELDGSYGKPAVRVLKYIDDPTLKAKIVETVWPAFVADPRYNGGSFEYQVKKIYQELGIPEQAEAMLAEAKKGKKPRKHRSRTYVPKTVTKISNLAPIRELPTDSKSVAKWWVGLHKVRAMSFAQRGLFVSFSGQKRANGLPTKEAIYCWDQRKNKWQVYETLNRNGATTTSMLYHDGYLWLTFLDEDVARWDPATGKTRRYSARKGTPSQRLNASCVSGNKIYFGGGESTHGALGSIDLETEKWAQYDLGQYERQGKKFPVPSVKKLAGNSDWVAVYADHHGSANQILLFEQNGGKRIDLGMMLKISNPDFSHSPSSWRPKVHAMVFIDQVLWIATTRGLVAFDPRKKEFVHIERLGYELASMLHDGENIWFSAFPWRDVVGMSDPEQTTCVLQFDLPSKTWKTQIPIPYKRHVMHIARQGDTLWVAPASEDDTVATIDISSLRN